MKRFGARCGGVALFAACAAAGCDWAQRGNASAAGLSQETRSSHFNAAAAATVRGVVRWRGPAPEAPPFEIYPNPLAGEVLSHRQTRANPNRPIINPSNRGIWDAVVFLRGIDPDRARPWDLPPVRVEQRDCELHVLQGAADSHVGFVRRGEAIEMVSHDRFFHSLHADGASFFTYTFPDPDAPLCRTLDHEGLVELTSAAGYYWMRAYVFVAEHPYHVRTDAEGRFELRQVPPENYQIVCWLPNWRKARHERDPESSFITRWYFRPPLESVQQLSVSARECREVHFTIGADD
jgi:hypothetical protein